MHASGDAHKQGGRTEGWQNNSTRLETRANSESGGNNSTRLETRANKGNQTLITKHSFYPERLWYCIEHQKHVCGYQKE